MASPAGKKKEENSLKLLRELISLPHNKQCFECQQKGPTYVDMTTVAFICTQCSGFLRGVNPPHRVKSVSMTTFSSEEIEKLRNGGNEMARMIWMGRWDPKRDREPTKKDEQAFKEFLRDKYDRKKWYRDPSEVKKDIASKSPDATPTSPPTSLPTPPTQSNSRPVATATSSTPPSKPTTQQPASKPQNLIDDFGADPFAPKVPTGGVAVLPSITPGPTPLISTSPIPVVSQQQGGTSNDFGAFTSATTSGGGLLQPSNTSGGISQPSGPQPPASNPLTIPLGSGSDRYAALASLDQTLKDIRLKEEEKEQQEKQQQLLQQQQQQQQLLQQQQQQQQQQLMQQQQQMMQQQLLQQQQRAGMMGGRPNPFGATPPIQKQDSNPFLLGTAPPVTGPTKLQGGAFGPSMVGGYAPGMMGGMHMQQPQQFGGFPGQQGMMMAGPVGSMMPGGQGMMMPQGGAQWQQPQQQAQWGMMQMPGGMGVAPGTPPQQFSTPQQFSGFGGNQTNKAGTQFGGFVSASPDSTPPLATGRQLNWSTGQTTPTTTAATSFNTNMGWSSDLSKPTISSQPQVSTVPTGWSTGLMTGAGTQFGTQTQQPTGGWGNQTTSMGGWGTTQPQSNTSGWGVQSSMGGWGVGVQPNPFSKPSGSSQQQPSNPFM